MRCDGCPVSFQWRGRNSPEQNLQLKRRKNNIWQSVIHESKLEDAFKCTDLNENNLITVERGTESYAFDGEEIESELADPNLTLKTGSKRGRKKCFPPSVYNCSIPRDHYGVNFYSSPEEITKAITNFLREQRDDLVEKIVNTLGSKRALEFCYLTEDIERLGGMTTADGVRQRTPGGIFFFLIRNSDRVSAEDKKAIFRNDATAKMHKKRMRQKLNRRGKARVAELGQVSHLVNVVLNLE
ncbi:hypothetical protein Aperf_G00000019957 [Anoplocephala perfoliata]